MAVTNEFKDAVKYKKIIRIRVMLKDSLLTDPTAGQFNEMEQYASQNMVDVYMNHDGENLQGEDAWNENYLNQQMVNVVNNFSRERIDLLKNMVCYLYKDKVNKIYNERNSQKNLNITNKQLGTGMAVAGAALTVAGVYTSYTMLTIGGIVIVAAGAVLIINDKGNV